jgi:hypothetical protein
MLEHPEIKVGIFSLLFAWIAYEHLLQCVTLAWHFHTKINAAD